MNRIQQPVAPDPDGSVAEQLDLKDDEIDDYVILGGVARPPPPSPCGGGWTHRHIGWGRLGAQGLDAIRP